MNDESADVIAPPPFLYAGPLVLGLLLQWRRPKSLVPGGAGRTVGALLVGLGATLVVNGFRTLRSAGEHPDPSQPTHALVTTGPYSFSRNPLYLALTLIYSGITLVANSFWSALFAPVVLLVVRRGVIDREEQYLERRFGDEYRQYKHQVRRWI